MKKMLIVLSLLLFYTGTAHAILVKENVEYKDGDAALEGYIVYDSAFEGKRPGIVVVHDWMGFGEYSKMRADMLAKLGYVALAADIYGKDVRPENREQAAAQSGMYKADRELLRSRVNSALNELKKHPMIDTSKTAAIGYCFGGTTVLELARSGADVTGVVTFHGGLDAGTIADAEEIPAKVLVLHGADDPHVSQDEIDHFMEEMNAHNVDWQMMFYADAVHSFTNKAAGNNKESGNAYNEQADKRSWEAMKIFFKEIFGNND